MISLGKWGKAGWEGGHGGDGAIRLLYGDDIEVKGEYFAKASF